MMRVVKPASVSIEDALRNLAGRLTGCPPGDLPRTQEGLVQFLAENLPTVEELAEVVTQEVLARQIGRASCRERVSSPV